MTKSSYTKDWKDGLTPKSVATVAFMYFACVAPMVGFGQLTGLATGGALGVPHFFASAALSGIVYATFAGQPMTFIGPTGLSFAFVSALYSLCSSQGWPFFGLYVWSGLWCAAFLAVLACGGACSLVSLVTRFTDDVFNGLIVLTFLITAVNNIGAPFAAAGLDKTLPFIDAALAIGTFLVARLCSRARSSTILTRRLRGIVTDFGPVIAIAATTLVARSPIVASVAAVRGLAVPPAFELGRAWLLPLLPSGGVPAWMPIVSILPGILLTLLFFLDQNITSRVVNNPVNGLRKGATYNLDLLVIAAVIAMCSLLGLPWMVGATVQSLAHVRAMSEGGGEAESGSSSSSARAAAPAVVETRLTGFATHVLIGCSAFLLPMLRVVPAAAINGLFLYLGVRMVQGNAMFARIALLFRDPSLRPHPFLQGVRLGKAHLFTVFQVSLLALMWFVRSMPSTALLFPSMIVMLVWMRLKVVPMLLDRTELEALDELVPAEEAAKASSAGRAKVMAKAK